MTHTLNAPYYYYTMTQFQINLLLALTLDALVHITIEIWSVREKVRRLVAYMNHKPYKELPVNINTRLKSYSVSLLGFVLFTGLGYLLFDALNLSADTAYKTMVGMFVLMFVVIAVGLDKYHVEIERVTKPFKNKTKS